MIASFLQINELKKVKIWIYFTKCLFVASNKHIGLPESVVKHKSKQESSVHQGRGALFLLQPQIEAVDEW